MNSYGFKQFLNKAIPLGIAVVTMFPAQAQAAMQEQLVPARTLQTYEKGTFLESVVTRRDGSLIYVDHTTHNVFEMKPAGDTRVVAHLGTELRGLALGLDDTIYITGRQKTGVESVFTVLGDGKVEPVIELPDAAFLNGITLLQPNVFLVADSYGGVIWRVDTAALNVQEWLRHPWLGTNPENPQIPGANGIKLYDGSVYVSNSGMAKVLRVPLEDSGSAGAPEVFIDGLVIDDFAFSKTGVFYGTTHIFDTVVVVRDGQAPVVIAGPEQGVVGSTAVSFGVTDSDAKTLYVVGDGGVFMPPEGGVVPAKVVALEVGEVGLSPIESLSWIDKPNTIESQPSYMVRCETAPGTDALRSNIGARYLRYLELNASRIAFAGQLFDKPGGSPSARIYFVIENDIIKARRFIETSPYFVAGLYSACEVGSFNALMGTLMGGVGWPAAASELIRRQ